MDGNQFGRLLLCSKGAVRDPRIFNKEGMYGRWGWCGNVAYITGFIAMTPFFVTTPYVCPAASHLANADYSLLVGLVSGTIPYLLLARGVDVNREMAKAAREGVPG